MKFRMMQTVLLTGLFILILYQSSNLVNTPEFYANNISLLKKQLDTKHDIKVLPVLTQDSLAITQESKISLYDENMNLISAEKKPEGNFIPYSNKIIIEFDLSTILITSDAKEVMKWNYSSINPIIIEGYGIPVIEYFRTATSVYIAAVFFTMNPNSGAVGQILYFFSYDMNSFNIVGSYNYGITYHYLFGFVEEITVYGDKFYFPDRETSLRIELYNKPFALSSFNPVTREFSREEFTYPFYTPALRSTNQINFFMNGENFIYTLFSRDTNGIWVFSLINSSNLETIFQVTILNDLKDQIQADVFLEAIELYPRVTYLPLIIREENREIASIGLILSTDYRFEPYLFYYNDISLTGFEESITFDQGFQGSFYISFSDGEKTTINKLRPSTIGQYLSQTLQYKKEMSLGIVLIVSAILIKQKLKNLVKRELILYPSHKGA